MYPQGKESYRCWWIVMFVITWRYRLRGQMWRFLARLIIWICLHVSSSTQQMFLVTTSCNTRNWFQECVRPPLKDGKSPYILVALSVTCVLNSWSNSLQLAHPTVTQNTVSVVIVWALFSNLWYGIQWVATIKMQLRVVTEHRCNQSYY